MTKRNKKYLTIKVNIFMYYNFFNYKIFSTYKSHDYHEHCRTQKIISYLKFCANVGKQPFYESLIMCFYGYFKPDVLFIFTKNKQA